MDTAKETRSDGPAAEEGADYSFLEFYKAEDDNQTAESGKNNAEADFGKHLGGADPDLKATKIESGKQKRKLSQSSKGKAINSAGKNGTKVGNQSHMSDSALGSAVYQTLTAGYDANKIKNLRSVLDQKAAFPKPRRASNPFRERGSSGGSQRTFNIATGSSLIAPPPSDLRMQRKNSNPSTKGRLMPPSGNKATKRPASSGSSKQAGGNKSRKPPTSNMRKRDAATA